MKIVLLALLLLAGCKRPDQGPAKLRLSPVGGAAAGAAVNVAAARTGPISKSVDVTGSLVALRDVVVGAKSAGKLAAVYPHEGDRVSAGQTVAVMDTPDLVATVQQQQANVQAAATKEDQARVALQQAQNAYRNAQTTLKWTDSTTAAAVQTAKSALETAKQRLIVVREGARPQERQQSVEQVAAAKSNYEKAKSDLKRYQDLYREQAVSASQLDQAQAAFDSAQASYNSAQQALQLVQIGARPEEIRQAELAVAQAQDALNRARADRDQVQMRRDDVANAKVAIASAQAGVAAAKAGTDQVRAALKIAQEALNNAYIKSPINGIVAERRAEPGQQLGAGGAVMRIVDPSSVYFQAVLSESQYQDVRLEMPASVTVDALPGMMFRGRVSRILPVASSAARSFSVRIDIPADMRLRPQMFARGSILVETHRDAVLIPKDAVIFDPSTNQAHVFIDQDGQAQERTVRPGISNPRDIEVLSGVRPGEKVIVAGQSTLQSGDKIRVQ